MNCVKFNAISHPLRPNVAPLLSTIVPNVPYHLTCTEGAGDKKKGNYVYNCFQLPF